MNKAKQYYLLNEQKKALEKRLKVLREQLFVSAAVYPGYRVVTQQKRRQKVNDEALEQLLQQKGLWNQCKKEVVDHDLVEQAYIEGKITDEELRSIDGGRDVYLALTVEKVDEDGIQRNDDSDSGQSGSRTVHDWTHSEDPTQVSGDDTSLGETEDHSQTDVP